MKKHIVTLLLLLIIFIIPALAEDKASNDNDPRITFDVGSIKFTVPVGFTCTSNTEDDLSFENDDYAYLKILKYNTEGYSLQDCMDHLDDFVYYDTITVRNVATINGIQMFALDYIYKYSGLDIYGDYIGTVDSYDNTLYILNYYATRPFNEVDVNNIHDLMQSIHVKTLQETPEPTPTPIVEPTATPAPVFDFDAINRNPDKYEGEYFGIIGTVVQVVDESKGDSGTIVSARIATQGSDDDIIYMLYVRQPDEDRILEGDKISFTGCAHGLFSYVNRFNRKISIPEFYGYYVTVLND